MTFDLSTPELARALDGARQIDDLEAALAAIEDLVHQYRDPAIYGRKLFLPMLDEVVPRVASRLGLADRPQPKSNGNACIVASRLYAVGGHSRVAEDIAARLDDGSTTLVMTDPKRQIRHRQLLNNRQGSPYRVRASLLLAAETRVERILELYELLAAVRPSRIFLLCHHVDPVAVIALWPFRDVVEFLHHADHLPALGATLSWSAHVDLTYTCHLACRKRALDPVYAGLAAPKVIAAGEAAPGRTAPLRIATAGSLNKFEGRLEHAWTDYAVAALARPEVEFVHIGPADAAFRARIGEALAAAGIDRARYLFTGPVKSVGAELIAQGVCAYLCSYPEPGAKAVAEALAAQVPVIVPMGAARPPLLHLRLPISRWIAIDHPDEVQSALDRALASAAALRTPEVQAEIAAELARFDNYVAGSPRPRISETERLADPD